MGREQVVVFMGRGLVFRDYTAGKAGVVVIFELQRHCMLWSDSSGLLWTYRRWLGCGGDAG